MRQLADVGTLTEMGKHRINGYANQTEYQRLQEYEERVRRQEAIVNHLVSSGSNSQLSLAKSILTNFKTALSLAHIRLANQSERKARGDLTSLRFVVRQLAQKEGRDFTVRQLGVLLTIHLDDTGQHTLLSLSEALGSNVSGLSRTLDRLEQDGFIRREVNPGDRRRFWIKPTEKVDELMKRLRFSAAE
jgi:DNA-binding MarR family transcriptional regulator